MTRRNSARARMPLAERVAARQSSRAAAARGVQTRRRREATAAGRGIPRRSAPGAAATSASKAASALARNVRTANRTPRARA